MLGTIFRRKQPRAVRDDHSRSDINNQSQRLLLNLLCVLDATISRIWKCKKIWFSEVFKSLLRYFVAIVKSRRLQACARRYAAARADNNIFAKQKPETSERWKKRQKIIEMSWIKFTAFCFETNSWKLQLSALFARLRALNDLFQVV